MAKIPKATATEPDILEWKLSWTILAGIALAGVVLIFYVHNFQRTPSFLFLSLGWVSILGAGAFLWETGLLIAAGDDGDTSSFRRTRTRGDHLQAEKQSLLKAIKEVEFDHAMGKMSDFDAKQITSVYRQRALIILKELDSRKVVGDSTGTEVITVAERIERDIRARSTLAAADRKAQDRAEARKREGLASEDMASEDEDMASEDEDMASEDEDTASEDEAPEVKKRVPTVANRAEALESLRKKSAASAQEEE